MRDSRGRRHHQYPEEKIACRTRMAARPAVSTTAAGFHGPYPDREAGRESGPNWAEWSGRWGYVAVANPRSEDYFARQALRKRRSPGERRTAPDGLATACRDCCRAARPASRRWNRYSSRTLYWYCLELAPKHRVRPAWIGNTLPMLMFFSCESPE